MIFFLSLALNFPLTFSPLFSFFLAVQGEEKKPERTRFFLCLSRLESSAAVAEGSDERERASATERREKQMTTTALNFFAAAVAVDANSPLRPRPSGARSLPSFLDARLEIDVED